MYFFENARDTFLDALRTPNQPIPVRYVRDHSLIQHPASDMIHALITTWTALASV